MNHTIIWLGVSSCRTSWNTIFSDYLKAIAICVLIDKNKGEGRETSTIDWGHMKKRWFLTWWYVKTGFSTLLKQHTSNDWEHSWIISILISPSSSKLFLIQCQKCLEAGGSQTPPNNLESENLQVMRYRTTFNTAHHNITIL